MDAFFNESFNVRFICNFIDDTFSSMIDFYFVAASYSVNLPVYYFISFFEKRNCSVDGEYLVVGLSNELMFYVIQQDADWLFCPCIIV